MVRLSFDVSVFSSETSGPVEYVACVDSSFFKSNCFPAILFLDFPLPSVRLGPSFVEGHLYSLFALFLSSSLSLNWLFCCFMCSGISLSLGRFKFYDSGNSSGWNGYI